MPIRKSAASLWERRFCFVGQGWFLAACVVVMLVWYGELSRVLAHRTFALGLFHPALLGMAFNSMLEHLLEGRFDVDPAAIDFEAFLVGDRTVSYFGVFCALLRLPLWLTGRLARTDMTGLSCLVAVCLGGWFQLRAVLLVYNESPASTRRMWLCGAMIACILFGGQQVQFLRPSIYQEVIDWADAFAMAFVFLALRGVLTGRGFDARTLATMALCAGLGLLTRVTFGVGMYAALAGLCLVRWRQARLAVPAVLVLAVFAGLAGVVNAGRWGNPLVFADFTRYAMSLDTYTDRLVRLATYGTFNLRRLWFGLGYYFVPVWGLVRPDGELLFAATQERLFDAVELPPGSFFITDPLLLALCGVGIATVRRRDSAGVLAGLAVQTLLILCALSLSWRYRVEFFPLLVFGGLLGLRHLCRQGGLAPRWRAAIAAAAVLSIIASHGMAAIYAVSPWGPSEQYINRDGWIGTYAPLLRGDHD